MQLEQSFSLQAPPEIVWAAFHDVRLLVECLPGASLKDAASEPAQGEDIPLTFKVKLGPIGASFAGTGRIALDETAQGGNFAGSAVDGKTNSRVKGEARFQVSPADDGTRVTMHVDYTITGALAQFSREGIVRALADTLSRQFAENLQARLQDASDGVASAVADGASAISVWSVLKASWRRSPKPDDAN
jgi:carbon monoxide dehydrogenase subunit G